MDYLFHVNKIIIKWNVFLNFEGNSAYSESALSRFLNPVLMNGIKPSSNMFSGFKSPQNIKPVVNNYQSLLQNMKLSLNKNPSLNKKSFQVLSTNSNMDKDSKQASSNKQVTNNVIFSASPSTKKAIAFFPFPEDFFNIDSNIALIKQFPENFPN